MKKILCATLEDIDAKEVEVEVSFIRGLPGFSIVGLAQTSIQESRARLVAALGATGFKFPPQKLIVNLSPSDIKKEGTHFDLPVALLIALYKEEVDFENFVAFGELGLDGKLKDTNSIFPIVLSLAAEFRNKTIIIPEESLQKISKIPNLKLLTADTLVEAVKLIKNKKQPVQSSAFFDFGYIMIDDKKYYYQEKYYEDFRDIKGQQRAIRASLISASGFHNILYEGSPGCGKSMCAKRLQFILPPMSLKEILKKAKIDSLTNKEVDFTPLRAFRSPHHTASRASIFGGSNKSIGEVALANGGEFFADELPHFSKSVLESLREPLQDHKILISRVKDKISYETKFVFVAAQNPCPCGNLFSKTKECRCSELEIKRYKNRISSPMLDRIELYVQMEEIDLKDKAVTSSKEMFKEVLKAFKMQKQRKQSEFNGKLSDSDIEKYCILDKETQNILNNAIIRYELSQRGINNIKKVSRTIADLDESKDIKKEHLMEALSYRMK